MDARDAVERAVAELVASLPSGVVVTDPDAAEKYRFDWTHDARAGHPAAVVRAENAGHVVTTMRWATRHGIPVVPRGAGSGLSGGALAVDGGIVLSTERMRAVEIDVDARVAVVEPGALNVEVKRAAAEHGLWYPPDPSSFEMCSIGGNIATNAGGLCCVKYGVTTDYVLGLDVVLADGTPVTLGGKRVKDAAGLSLLKLFVGSEGTLGVVTRAILRLVPGQQPPATVVATFPSVAAAADAVIALGRTVRASMVELMDHGSINAVEDHTPMGLNRDAGALLLIQSDAPSAARADEVAAAVAACEGAGASEVFATDDPAEGEMFVRARRLHFTAIEARGNVLPEDVGVPVPQLPALLAAVAEIAARHDLEIPMVAHAGDGNTHPAIVYPPVTRMPSAARASPSTTSWPRPSPSAAPSPASTGWGASRPARSRRSSARTSWRSTGASRRRSTRTASSTRARSSDRRRGLARNDHGQLCSGGGSWQQRRPAVGRAEGGRHVVVDHRSRAGHRGHGRRHLPAWSGRRSGPQPDEPARRSRPLRPGLRRRGRGLRQHSAEPSPRGLARSGRSSTPGRTRELYLNAALRLECSTSIRTQELGAHAVIPGGDPNWCVPIEVLRGIRTIARHPNFRVALDLPHGIRPPPTQQLACT
jgi:glycolate oxidase